jgi:DNA-binding PadR family transcriptional regulator
MSTAETLLALLEQEPVHGYTLKHRYDARFARTRPLAFGQVYSSLARFERQGWAEVVEVETGVGPERKRYRITKQGVTVVDAFVNDPQQPTGFAASTLFARVSVALISGRSAPALLDAQREIHLVRMRELTEARRTADSAELLAVTYELAHLDADLTWMDEASDRLDAMRDALVGGQHG